MHPYVIRQLAENLIEERVRDAQRFRLGSGLGSRLARKAGTRRLGRVNR